MFLILLIIVVAPLINFFNDYFSVNERKDIGVLRILGVKNSNIKIFVINGSIIGILGTLLDVFWV